MKKSVKILIVVLCLIIVGLVTFIVADKVINTKKEESINNESNNVIVAENNNNEIESSNTTSTKVTDTNQGENNNSNNATTTNETAIEAIKKALKDDNWIKENVSTDWENLEKQQQELTFICLKKDNDEIPIIIVNCFIEGNVYNKATLVTYDRGKIKTETICDGYMRDLEVDPNNKILEVTDCHGGVWTYDYSKVESKSVSFIEWISEPVDEDYEISGYHYGTENESNEITKEEFDKIKNKYDGYSFVSIETKLTNENIDKYIK